MALSEKQAELAWRAHEAGDMTLPYLPCWNYDPCKDHEEIDPYCHKCAVVPRKHQRIGIPWLYLREKALLADTVGSGKTIHAAGLLALLASRGELGSNMRAVVIMRPAAIVQWNQELHRMLNGINIIQASGTKNARRKRYAQPWDVCLISYMMLLRDIEQLEFFHPNLLIIDDVDPLRNRDNATSRNIKLLTRVAPRVVVMTGTPLQKRLHEAHSVLECVGGNEVFGREPSFMRRYVRQEHQEIWVRNKKGKPVRRSINKVAGYKNLDEFKRLIAPMVMRRIASEMDDVSMPSVAPPNIVMLELTKDQEAAYEDLRKGVVKLIHEEGENVKQISALSKILYGAAICAGMHALGHDDIPGVTSPKLDWTVDTLTGDLEEEKVVVYVHRKKTVYALQDRLTNEDVPWVTVSGDDRDPANRQAAIDRFWDPDGARVLIGTGAIEQSLNLQCARHLIYFDTILNPGRMEQLIGRIKRDGSKHETVYPHFLRMADSQEDYYADLLEREQALVDYIWDEQSDLFEALPPLALLQLITGDYRTSMESVA